MYLRCETLDLISCSEHSRLLLTSECDWESCIYWVRHIYACELAAMPSPELATWCIAVLYFWQLSRSMPFERSSWHSNQRECQNACCPVQTWDEVRRFSDTNTHHKDTISRLFEGKHVIVECSYSIKTAKSRDLALKFLRQQPKTLEFRTLKRKGEELLIINSICATIT